MAAHTGGFNQWCVRERESEGKGPVLNGRDAAVCVQMTRRKQ
jgi:hypothetical protein